VGRSVVVVDSPGPKSVRVVAQARFAVPKINPMAKTMKRAFWSFMLPSGFFSTQSFSTSASVIGGRK
jgi:hypothetical protein